MKRKLLSLIVLLALVSISSCDGRADIPDTSAESVRAEQPTEAISEAVEEVEEDWNIATDAYTVTDVNGTLYLKVKDGYRASAEDIRGCTVADVYFDSLEDMRSSFRQNDFTKQELVVMQAAFAQDDNGIRICDMTALMDVVKPRDTQLTGIGLNGEYYDFHLSEEGMFRFGWVCYDPKEIVQSWKDLNYILYDGEGITVTRNEETTFDGVPCRVVEYHHTYEYYRDIYIDVAEENRNVNIVIRYLTDYTKGDGLMEASATAPQSVMMFGEADGVAFRVGLYEFSQAPAYEWLASFGLTHYVPAADDALSAE